jgi:hypothetical protein
LHCYGETIYTLVPEATLRGTSLNPCSSTMEQLVCFGPCFLQGSQLFLVMPPQQSKISGKHVFLYSPGLKEHIPVFIIIFRPKLQELRGVEVAPPLSTGAKTYQLYHRNACRYRIMYMACETNRQKNPRSSTLLKRPGSSIYNIQPADFEQLFVGD